MVLDGAEIDFFFLSLSAFTLNFLSNENKRQVHFIFSTTPQENLVFFGTNYFILLLLFIILEVNNAEYF